MLFWPRGWALIRGRALIRAWVLIRGNTVFMGQSFIMPLGAVFLTEGGGGKIFEQAPFWGYLFIWEVFVYTSGKQLKVQ